MKISKKLVAVLLLALFLRVYKLGSIPPGLTPHEATVGYNAYSILKTGKDEYGRLLPLSINSFSDNNSALNVYLTIPFVAVLGLNELAVRLPNAIGGVMAVYLIYKIASTFISSKKNSLFSFAEAAALLLAVSPWHIHFSRGIWDVNLALTLSLAGLLLFLNSLKKKKFSHFALIFFLLSFLIYQGTWAFSQLGNLNEILRRWFMIYSPRFLFFAGDLHDRAYFLPNHGVMMLVDAILLPLGLYVLVRNKLSKEKLFVIAWLILSPLLSTLFGSSHETVGALNLVIPLVLVSSFGLMKLLNFLEANFKRQILPKVSLIFMFLISFSYFFDSYYVHLPIHNAKHLYYGYKEIIEEITPIQHDYDKIIFQQTKDEPYIYFLFFQKHDPEIIQGLYKTSLSSGTKAKRVEKLDNIIFQEFSWPHATGEKNVLLVGNPVAIPADFSEESYSLVTELKYPDNFMTAFRMMETK